MRMMNRCIKLFMIPALVPFFYSTALAQLNLSVESGAGYKTNVPSLTDSLFDDFPFAMVRTEPVYTFLEEQKWNGEFTVEAEYSRYFHGPAEWNIDPALVFSRNAENYKASAGLSAGYYRTAADYDPTIPRRYGIVSFAADYSIKRPQPITLYYSLATVNDAESGRMDYRNSLKCRVSWKPEPGNSLFIKPGMLWVVSNEKSTSYVQPSISGGVTRTFSKNVFLTQAYVAYPCYGTVMIKKQGRGNKRTESLTFPRAPHTMLYCGMIRGITTHMDFYINYDFTLLDRGTGEPLYVSHGLGLSLEYGVERLLPFDKKDRT